MNWPSKTGTAEAGWQDKLVGDDIFETNPAIVEQAIEKKVANSVLIKLNQIGSVSETLDRMRIARGASRPRISSVRWRLARSGATRT